MGDAELKKNDSSELDVEDWLKGWGSLTKEPSYEEKEALENSKEVADGDMEVTEFEPTYEGGMDLLGQLAEKFTSEPSQDYNDADRLMIADMMRKAQIYAQADEKKDVNTAFRALEMNLTDINNALMVVDKPSASDSAISEIYAKRRNAQRARDEYLKAYGDAKREGVANHEPDEVLHEEVSDELETEVAHDIEAEPSKFGPELPGDVIS